MIIPHTHTSVLEECTREYVYRSHEESAKHHSTD